MVVGTADCKRFPGNLYEYGITHNHIYTGDDNMTSRETFGDRTRTHGMTNTRLYALWCGIKLRCYNPHYKHFDRYGGRGITVCEEWRSSFENFRDWAMSTGYDESLSGKEQSIDRIDVNGNYEPSNCRWITMAQQARNRSDTVYVSYMGQNIPISLFAKDNSIDKVYVFRNVKAGRSGEEILVNWNMIHNRPSEYMSVAEAMAYYNVTDMTIRAWIKKGKLTAEKRGQRWYILRGQNAPVNEGRDEMGRFLPGR